MRIIYLAVSYLELPSIVLVTNLSWQVSEADLSFLASKIDASHSVRVENVIVDNGTFKRNGWVTFNEPHFAAEFIEATNTMVLYGQTISCEIDDGSRSVSISSGSLGSVAALCEAVAEPHVTVTVEGLPSFLRAEQLFKLFEPFRPISSSVDMRADGVSLQTGGVIFASYDDAVSAIKDMNFTTVNGHLLNVSGNYFSVFIYFQLVGTN